MGTQGGQDSLATIITKRIELEELRKTQATLTTTINTALAKYKDSLNDASLKLADVQSKKAFFWIVLSAPDTAALFWFSNCGLFFSIILIYRI